MLCRNFLKPSFWGLSSKFTLRCLFFLLPMCQFFLRLCNPCSRKKNPTFHYFTSLFDVSSLHYLICCSLLYFSNFLVSGSSVFCICLRTTNSRKCLFGGLPSFAKVFLRPYPHHLGNLCLSQSPQASAHLWLVFFCLRKVSLVFALCAHVFDKYVKIEWWPSQCQHVKQIQPIFPSYLGKKFIYCYSFFLITSWNWIWWAMAL